MNAVYLLKGEFALAWKMYAKSLQDEADIADVREWVDHLNTTYPEEGYVHLLQGLFLAQSGQSEQSITSYQKAMELVPDSPFPHFFLAQIYQRMAQADKAIKAYRQAVKLDPAYLAARLNLGVAYQEHGQLEMAIPQYRELIKLAPDDALGYVNLACALAEQGKIDAAIREYKTALHAQAGRLRRYTMRWPGSMNKKAGATLPCGSIRKRCGSSRTSDRLPRKSGGF